MALHRPKASSGFIKLGHKAFRMHLGGLANSPRGLEYCEECREGLDDICYKVDT